MYLLLFYFSTFWLIYRFFNFLMWSSYCLSNIKINLENLILWYVLWTDLHIPFEFMWSCRRVLLNEWELLKCWCEVADLYVWMTESFWSVASQVWYHKSYWKIFMMSAHSFFFTPRDMLYMHCTIQKISIAYTLTSKDTCSSHGSL